MNFNGVHSCSTTKAFTGVGGEFINVAFSEYAADCDVALNFEEFCFVAEDDGKIAGVITGRAYYNEVHIGDLIVGKACRESGIRDYTKRKEFEKFITDNIEI